MSYVNDRCILELSKLVGRHEFYMPEHCTTYKLKMNFKLHHPNQLLLYLIPL
jgi:hypothetical protein